MSSAADLPIIAFESPETWEQWLDANQADSNGIWMRISKKGASPASINYAEALDGALCYGWIDGRKNRYDDQSGSKNSHPAVPAASGRRSTPSISNS